MGDSIVDIWRVGNQACQRNRDSEKRLSGESWNGKEPGVGHWRAGMEAGRAKTQRTQAKGARARLLGRHSSTGDGMGKLTRAIRANHGTAGATGMHRR